MGYNPSMEISLTPEWSRVIERQIASGGYADAQAVVEKALQCMLEEEAAQKDHEYWMMKQVDIGLAEAERGDLEPHSMDDIIAYARSQP